MVKTLALQARSHEFNSRQPHCAVAQVVERPPVKRKATGSNPVRTVLLQGVGQFGSPPVLGTGNCGFKSHRPDMGRCPESGRRSQPVKLMPLR